MPSTKEAKIKKDKSSKKAKVAEAVETVTEIVTESEDVAMADAPEVETKKAKKEKKEKKEKKSKKTDAATEVEDDAEPKEVKVKKSKRKAEDVESEAKEASPAPDSMDVDDSSEPPAKKHKSVVPEGEELEVDVTLPQPPSKKELRRLKKGKSLPQKKTTSELKAPKPEGESGAEDGDDKPKKLEQEKRSEHGIWVGNLPWSVSKEDLKSFLINQGPIEDEHITRIHMPSPDDGKPANRVESRFTRKQHNKGFAYVDFSTADDTTKAVALSEELLGGRRVLIKNAKSFEGRPLVVKTENGVKKPEGKPPNKRIFLGNLRFDTTEESLKEHFEKCGPIEQCMVATFEDSGKCKGYAWITFEELASAERAVRGFYLEEVPDSDDEDTDDEEEAAEPDSDPEDYAEAVEKAKKPAKKPIMKRVYVNMIQRRPIRIEFAEDAGVRYKKRYGAGGTKNAGGEEGGPRVEKPKEEKLVSGVIAPSRKAQKMEYRSEYAPRLTGGIVEHKGTKVTF